MIYIGNFYILTNQQEQVESDRRHGEFNLIVYDAKKESAMEKFKQCILDFREQSSLFEGHCKIYFNSLIEFAHIPQESAKMVNYRSFAGDPGMPFIQCTAPTSEENSCTIESWEDDHLQTEGYTNKLFMEF